MWLGHMLWGTCGCSGCPEVMEGSTMSHSPKGQQDMSVTIIPLPRGDPGSQSKGGISTKALQPDLEDRSPSFQSRSFFQNSSSQRGHPMGWRAVRALSLHHLVGEECYRYLLVGTWNAGHPAAPTTTHKRTLPYDFRTFSWAFTEVKSPFTIICI